MPFFYPSGEQIEAGDRVRLHGETGEVEFVADPAVDPDNWYGKEHGGGVMVVEPKGFGRLFLNAGGQRLRGSGIRVKTCMSRA